MLTYLKIKNFALIEDAEIEFDSKFNVITGESGSGKSIILGALSLLTGERRDSNIIRTNAERCEVNAILKITENQFENLKKIFIENDLDISDLNREELSLRRVVNNSGSRNYINDSNVSAKIMQKVSGLFFDFNRPDDELSLNSSCRQLELLDRFGNIDTSECQNIYKELLECRKAIEYFESNSPKESEIEDAQNLIVAFEALNLQIDEDETLNIRHKMLANSQEIITSAATVVNSLTDGENSLADNTAMVVRELYNLNRLTENSTENFCEEIELISENIRELSQKLERFISSIDIDQEEFFNLENRLAEIHKMKRNYGPTLADVFANYESAVKLVSAFDSDGKKRAELAAKEYQLKQDLLVACQKLSKQRQLKANELQIMMLEQLKLIGFEKVNLKWIFKEVEPTANGFDDAELLFSANHGENLYPLRKIASSGERSRLFLAIKSVLAKVDDIPIVIFDEIDANVGGETANKVAKMIRGLANYRQIILISHLAQLASKATNHLFVYKKVVDNRTYSYAYPLKNDERVEEIARLLTGESNLEIAKLHAKELLGSC